MLRWAKKLYNSLPCNKIFDWFKLKAFADNNSNVTNMTISVLERTETLRKKEKMLITSIFSFSHMFSKGCFLRVVKTRDWVVKLIMNGRHGQIFFNRHQEDLLGKHWGNGKKYCYWYFSVNIFLLFTLYQTTKFQTASNWKQIQTTIWRWLKIWNLVCEGQKTVWKKEKMLVTSIFSFSHNVYKRLLCWDR